MDKRYLIRIDIYTTAVIDFNSMRFGIMPKEKSHPTNWWFLHIISPTDVDSLEECMRISMDNVFNSKNSIPLNHAIRMAVYKAYEEWLVDKEMEKVLGGGE